MNQLFTIEFCAVENVCACGKFFLQVFQKSYLLPPRTLLTRTAPPAPPYIAMYACAELFCVLTNVSNKFVFRRFPLKGGGSIPLSPSLRAPLRVYVVKDVLRVEVVFAII